MRDSYCQMAADPKAEPVNWATSDKSQKEGTVLRAVPTWLHLRKPGSPRPAVPRHSRLPGPEQWVMATEAPLTDRGLATPLPPSPQRPLTPTAKRSGLTRRRGEGRPAWAGGGGGGQRLRRGGGGPGRASPAGGSSGRGLARRKPCRCSSSTVSLWGRDADRQHRPDGPSPLPRLVPARLYLCGRGPQARAQHHHAILGASPRAERFRGSRPPSCGGARGSRTVTPRAPGEGAAPRRSRRRAGAAAGRRVRSAHLPPRPPRGEGRPGSAPPWWSGAPSAAMMSVAAPFASRVPGSVALAPCN